MWPETKISGFSGCSSRFSTGTIVAEYLAKENDILVHSSDTSEKKFIFAFLSRFGCIMAPIAARGLKKCGIHALEGFSGSKGQL